MRTSFKVLLAIGLGILVLPVALQSRVKDTVHNLNQSGFTVPNAEVCRPCHAPHNTKALEVGALWNHDLSGGGWGLYADADANSVFSGASRLCLSCHDGTVALDSYGGATGSQHILGSENLGKFLASRREYDAGEVLDHLLG